MDDENKNSNQPATLQVQYYLLGWFNLNNWEIFA